MDVKAYHYDDGIFMNEFYFQEVGSIIKNYFTVLHTRKGVLFYGMYRKRIDVESRYIICDAAVHQSTYVPLVLRELFVYLKAIYHAIILLSLILECPFFW